MWSSEKKKGTNPVLYRISDRWRPREEKVFIGHQQLSLVYMEATPNYVSIVIGPKSHHTFLWGYSTKEGQVVCVYGKGESSWREDNACNHNYQEKMRVRKTASAARQSWKELYTNEVKKIELKGVQVLRSTGHSSTIGIEEKNFDEYEKLRCSTRI
jgi:hypothetical protein